MDVNAEERETDLFSHFFYLKRMEGREPKPEPITDIREALVFLYEKDSGRTLELDGKHADGSRGAVIAINQIGGIYKMEVVGVLRFPISKGVEAELLERNLVSGIPRWGYTEKYKLRLNENGTAVLFAESRKFREEVQDA